MKQINKELIEESIRNILIALGDNPDREGLKELINNIDVLVDGKFEQDKKDSKLKFRGSSNQRIIDVKNSLKDNKVILYKINSL